MFEIRRLAEGPGPDSEEVEFYGDRSRKLFVEKQPIISVNDVVGVGVWDHDALVVDFAESEYQRLKKATGACVDESVAVILGGKVVSTPVIAEPFFESCVVMGEFREDYAAKMVVEISRVILNRPVELG